jgi:hypothetical protein
MASGFEGGGSSRIDEIKGTSFHPCYTGPTMVLTFLMVKQRYLRCDPLLKQDLILR